MKRVNVRRGEDGIALLMTLLVVALLSALAVAMNTRSVLAITRAKHSAHALQATSVLRSGISTAMAFLDKDAKESSIDTLDELWAQDVKDFPVGEGTVSVRVEDEASKFNLNTLVTPQGRINAKALERFARLLAIVGVNEALAPQVAEWLRINREPSAYTFRDPSELLLVPGVTPEMFARLVRHVTIFTERANARINANTVGREVLAALSPALTSTLVDGILEHRRQSPFKEIGGLKKVQGVNDEVLVTFGDVMDVKTSTFTVTAEAKVADVVRRGSGVVRREAGTVTLVIWRQE